jgi:hypothetical protein
MERILKTVREIWRTSWPRNAAGEPIVFDIPIKSWFHGDRQVISIDELPAIAFDSETRSTEFGTLRAREHTWNFVVNCYVRMDDTEFTLSHLHEILRIGDEIMREHTNVWVFEPCIFDMVDFCNPTHLSAHSEVASYKTQAEADYLAKWNATHQVQGTGAVATAPTMAAGNAWAVGYHNFYQQATAAGTATFSYQNAAGYMMYKTPDDVLSEYRRDLVRPVRLLSFVKVDSMETGFAPKMDGSFLRAGQLKISAKEIDPVYSFGPNNVI